MVVRILKDADGDYTEAVDGETGLVVRRILQVGEFGEYRSPFSGAHLHVNTTEGHGPRNEEGARPMYITVQTIGMAELATRRQCRKWRVPHDQIDAAIRHAVAAVELYARSCVYIEPVKIITEMARGLSPRA